MTNESVNKNLKKTRKEKSFTQKEMAEKMGISRTAYRNLEDGQTKLLSDHIGEFAQILGKTEEEILLGYAPKGDAGKNLAALRHDLKVKNDLIKAQQETISSQLNMIAMLSGK